MHNRELDLSVGELEFLLSIDLLGTKDYLTSLPGYSSEVKDEKAELRYELYKLITEKEPKYYEHKLLGGWEETNRRNGNIWAVVKSEADIMLSREDGLPDDLISIVEPTIITGLAMLSAYELGMFMTGVKIFGFKNALTMQSGGVLNENVNYALELSKSTDADERLISKLLSLHKDQIQM